MTDREVIEKYYELRSCRAVGEYFGCNGETIRRILKRNNVNRIGWKVPKKQPKYHCPARVSYSDEEIIAAYKRLGTQDLVRDELEISHTTVYRALKRNGMSVGKVTVCTYCGKEFVAKNIKMVYCSKKCKDIALRLRKGIKCNPNVEPFHKICVVCGKPFDTFRESSVTCSKECALYRRNKKKCDPKKMVAVSRIKNLVEERHGDQFEFVRRDKKTKRITLRCKTCGTEIERAVSTVRDKGINCDYCKEQKLKEAELNKARKNLFNTLCAVRELKTPKKCAYCGKTFYNVSPVAKYCSDKCKKDGRGRGYRARCRKYGCKYDPSVTRIKVLKRDQYICQICGKKCNPQDHRWGTIGPDFPTLDHIVPLAKGGSHTWDNVQCACSLCNSYKRDLDDRDEWTDECIRGTTLITA